MKEAMMKAFESLDQADDSPIQNIALRRRRLKKV